MKYSVCVRVCVSLVIQHAKGMRCIMLSSVACLISTYFSTLSHKWHDFPGEKKLLSTKFVFSFSLQIIREITPVLRTIQRDMTRNVKTYSRKVPVTLVGF